MKTSGEFENKILQYTVFFLNKKKDFSCIFIQKTSLHLYIKHTDNDFLFTFKTKNLEFYQKTSFY